MGHRGSAHYVCSRTQAICHSLYLLFAWWSGSIAGPNERLPQLRETWRHHVAGRQRCSAPASENQRTLGVDPSAHDAARSSHLDFLLPGSAPLGQSQAHAGSPARRLVGCQQDWNVADRKSTRLNSSHPSISYAVFCLKKKTNQFSRHLSSKKKNNQT